MPRTASSSSMRAQSCSRWYFSSPGYDSVAAMSRGLVGWIDRLLVVGWIDRLLDDSRAPGPSAHVDRQLCAGLRVRRRDVTHPHTAVEHRGMRAGGDLTATVDRHPRAGNRSLLHDEGSELSIGPALLDLAQRVRARELLVERATPSEPGRDGVGFGRDVLPMQGKARFEPQGVARAQTARLSSTLQDAIPQLARVLRRDEQLTAGLARIAGPIHHAHDPVDLAFG